MARLIRRHILSALSLLTVVPAVAQARTYRIALLSPAQASIDAFRQWALPNLAREGFVEGQNLTVMSRSSQGSAELLPMLAREIATARPDVVVAVSNAAAHAVGAADPRLPVVMGFSGTDPVADGLASSLGRPGGRVTGVVMLAEEADQKRIEFAKQMMPNARRFGYLAGSTYSDSRIVALERTGSAIGKEIIVTRSSGGADFERAISALVAAGAEALIVGSFPSFSGDAATLVSVAVDKHLPTFCEWRHMAEAGCLVSYGPVYGELHKRVATYISRILRGAEPGELPMEQVFQWELVVNLKTAHALSIAVPPLIMVRADTVIE